MYAYKYLSPRSIQSSFILKYISDLNVNRSSLSEGTCILYSSPGSVLYIYKRSHCSNVWIVGYGRTIWWVSNLYLFNEFDGIHHFDQVNVMLHVKSFFFSIPFTDVLVNNFSLLCNQKFFKLWWVQFPIEHMYTYDRSIHVFKKTITGNVYGNF